MKLKIDTQKGAEAVVGLLQKTTDVSKKAASEVQKGAIALSEKAKMDSYQRRLKKYNPLFPDVYHSAGFCVPNMIVIVDDAVRGIDVCEGSIGWRSSDSGIEVLFLYDESVKESGLQFVPSPICDTVYYVDRFSRNRFIQVDCIFNKSHEERLAELKHIAHSLGAKRCTIEISETSKSSEASHKKVALHERISIKGISASSNESAEQSSSVRKADSRSGRIHAEFEGSNSPKRPKLKWFAHDENIKRLIEARCNGYNTAKSETIELHGSSSSTMSQKTACVIDGALSKMKAGGTSKMEAQLVTENSTKMIFIVEF